MKGRSRRPCRPPMPKAGKPEREAKKAKRRPQDDFDVAAFLKKALGGMAALVAVLVGWARLSGRAAASATAAPAAGKHAAGWLPPIPPGMRPAGCANSLRNATGTKESVSIIIPYYHEELFRIEITMTSILRHTDMSLVKEIMWISDGNGPAQIFREELLAMHPKVTVHVNEENKGLIVTKMQAAARAQGSILMFTEPHTVAHQYWLEPLIDRLAEEPNALVMPTLDAVNGDMTNYHQMQFGHWRFEWNMNLIFTNPWKADMRGELGARPYPSPATSGGIYAIRKEWWDHLELFDPELIRWGGDHIEASHKVWRCGGRVEMHPCSRIAHWYRHAEERPYDVPVPQVVRNYKRLAEVWMDNHMDSFHKVKPEARSMEFGDVAEMHKARKRLECKDMDWYLKNVDLELAWEESHICIPGGAKSQNGCNSATPFPGRSTLDVTMPGDQYTRRWKKSPMHWSRSKKEL